jgi:Zn-dependent M28 family amino/carboxypeptidase
MSRLFLLALAASTALALPAAAGSKAPKTAPAAAPPSVEQVIATSAGLRDKALADDTAWQVVESLTTEVGPRMAGTPAAERAKEWGLAKLKALGFSNVHAEPFTVTGWERGPESAEVVGPYPQELAILGLGKTVATPPEGIEAEIALFHTYGELLAQKPGSLAGKIAVVTQPMARTQDGSGYGAAVRVRSAGPSEAAKRGAVAFLMRSVSTAENRSPHTGMTVYAADAPRIPAAALSPADAALLDHMAERGQPIRIRLKLANRFIENAPAWNVVGDIPGGSKPDQVIVIGGHLDSWDPGTGAIDDAAGIAITTAAARLIGELKAPPARTVRVVMWGSEETSGSGQAYADAHKDEVGKIVLAGESDLGSDALWSLALPKGAAGHPVMAAMPQVLAPLKIFVSPAPSRFGGADTEEIQALGVPVIDYNQSALRYFDVHHSRDDTLEMVDPVTLKQNVAAWAALVYAVADSDVDFRATAAAK